MNAKSPTSQADGGAATQDADIIAQRVEAVLMTVDRPINAGRIADVLGLESPKPVAEAIGALNDFYEKHDRAFRIEQVANGYQVMTLAEHRETLAALHKTRGDQRLSPAAMETLAIVAYRQPILRADIEAIRGVACGEVLRSLMDKALVRIAGRADEIGRPMLYGTTKQFLEVFGLASLKDLPKVEELNQP